MKTTATLLKKNANAGVGTAARQRYTVPKLKMSIGGAFDNN